MNEAILINGDRQYFVSVHLKHTFISALKFTTETEISVGTAVVYTAKGFLTDIMACFYDDVLYLIISYKPNGNDDTFTYVCINTSNRNAAPYPNNTYPVFMRTDKPDMIGLILDIGTGGVSAEIFQIRSLFDKAPAAYYFDCSLERKAIQWSVLEILDYEKFVNNECDECDASE
jgi:hypothetical protein